MLSLFSFFRIFKKEKGEMKRKAVSCIMLAMLLLALSKTISDFNSIEATPGTIYIRADGSIDPLTAPIERDGSLYTFTDDIFDTIVVQKSNIVVDGDGYTLKGSGSGIGFNLTSVDNVTVRHTNVDAFEGGIVLLGSANCSISSNYITNCDAGIWLDGSVNCTLYENDILYNDPYGVYFWDSTNCTIQANNITNNWDGAVFYGQSSYNNISLNNIIANDEVGLWFDDSSHCDIYSNDITHNPDGIVLSDSFGNKVYQNVIGKNRYGVYLEYSSDNKFYHNNFTESSWAHAYVATSGYANSWDDEYPSGGNFWGDYAGVDYYSGPNQDQPSADGLGDTPYVIDADNMDGYPLMIRELYDWPTIGYDPACTGYSPSTAPNTNTTAWVANLPAAGAGWWPYPIVSEGKVFIGAGGNLTAWNETDGDLIWNYEAPAGLGSPSGVAAAEGVVFSVTFEADAYASNATTGEHLWSLTGGTYGAPPVIMEDRLYLGGGLGSTGAVYCVNATTGAPIWSYSPTQDRVRMIAVAYGKVYVSCGSWETSTEGAIYCLDMYDGSFVWSFDTDRDYAGDLAVANGKVYFSASYEGWNCIVYALNATNGAVVWSATPYPDGDAGRTAVAYGKVFICLGYSDRGVYALNETNGDEIWAFPIIPEQPVQLHQCTPLWAVVADSKVFFGPSYPCHMFYAVSESTGSIIWSYRLTGAVEGGSGAVANGRVFVADHWDQKLYAFGSHYIARVEAYCHTEESGVSVGIMMDGLSTGYSTTHTFTELTGTHNFTVPSTDANGHIFKQWNTGETSTTITVSTGGTYTAYYQVKYDLNITTTAGGTTNPTSGNYSYWDGTIVNVSATPSLGYILDYWQLDDANVGTVNPISITMDTNHTLDAVFSWVGICNLTITTTTGGTTNPVPGTHSYTNGTVVSVSHSYPSLGYVFDHWELDGNNAGSSDSLSVIMNGNHTLQAAFSWVGICNLTITTTSGGTTNPSPGTYSYSNGTIASITATADPNYFFCYWLLDGQNVGNINPILVAMHSDHTLHASFQRIFPYGCPFLYVYDGEEYVNEGLLNIDSPTGSDISVNHTLNTQPQRVGDTYLFQLVESQLTVSHVDQVALYAVLEDGTTVKLSLNSAWHKDQGNVLPQLLDDDGWRTDLLGARWTSNGISQSIQLAFSALASNIRIKAFIFCIDGNAWCSPTD
jgi:parallel beta-helix repeat protein